MTREYLKNVAELKEEFRIKVNFGSKERQAGLERLAEESEAKVKGPSPNPSEDAVAKP